jgi:hypothetical protein
MSEDTENTAFAAEIKFWSRPIGDAIRAWAHRPPDPHGDGADATDTPPPAYFDTPRRTSSTGAARMAEPKCVSGGMPPRTWSFLNANSGKRTAVLVEALWVLLKAPDLARPLVSAWFGHRLLARHSPCQVAHDPQRVRRTRPGPAWLTLDEYGPAGRSRLQDAVSSVLTDRVILS